MSQQNEERSLDQDVHENAANRNDNSSHTNDSTENEYKLQPFTTSHGSYSYSSEQTNYLIQNYRSSTSQTSSDYSQSCYHQNKYEESTDESDYDERLDYCRVRKINDVDNDVVYKCTMDWGKRENEFHYGEW